MKTMFVALIMFSFAASGRADILPAEVRACLPEGLHPAISPRDLNDLLNRVASAGADGEALLLGEYGTNSLSHLLFSCTRETAALYSLDLAQGKPAPPRALENPRHPCDENDIQLINIRQEGENIATGTVCLARTNHFRAVCQFVVSRGRAEQPWRLEFLGLANRGCGDLILTLPVFVRGGKWSCFYRPGSWAERRLLLEGMGLGARQETRWPKEEWTAGAERQAALLKSIILEEFKPAFRLDPRTPTPTETWADKFCFLETELEKTTGKRVRFFLSPDLASETVPGWKAGVVLDFGIRRISLYDALNLICEDDNLRYDLSEHGVLLFFGPGRTRREPPPPAQSPPIEPVQDHFGFGP